MAEEAGAGSSSTSGSEEEDFYCPVCRDVLRTPVRTLHCRHVFCRKCFLTAIRESGTHCPLCRGSVTKKERSYPQRALDVENNMKKFSGSCKCCEKQVRYSRMRQHYKTCKKYQEEYGDSCTVPSLKIYQESTGNSAHPTFKCPLCQETNFTRQRLLDHCNNRHVHQICPVVCPICVSLPWEVSNQVTRNFVDHLNVWHRFDYGEFMNLQLDEETQFQNAVEESCHVNF